MEKFILFQIITPVGIKTEIKVDSINLKTDSGFVTILSNHVPMVGNYIGDAIEVGMNKTNKKIECKGGIYFTDGKTFQIFTN
jgi:F0F1-type ATP synthase epsilon subunit